MRFFHFSCFAALAVGAAAHSDCAVITGTKLTRPNAAATASVTTKLEAGPEFTAAAFEPYIRAAKKKTTTKKVTKPKTTKKVTKPKTTKKKKKTTTTTTRRRKTTTTTTTTRKKKPKTSSTSTTISQKPKSSSSLSTSQSSETEAASSTSASESASQSESSSISATETTSSTFSIADSAAAQPTSTETTTSSISTETTTSSISTATAASNSSSLAPSTSITTSATTTTTTSTSTSTSTTTTGRTTTTAVSASATSTTTSTTTTTTRRTTTTTTVSASATSSVSARVRGTPAVFAAAPYPSSFLLPDYDFRNSSQFSSDHFLIWNSTEEDTKAGLNILEATYNCYVHVHGWRNPGVSIYDDPEYGPFYKTNVFVTPNQPSPGASGVATGDWKTGLGLFFMLPEVVPYAGTSVHEYGHVMTYAQYQFWNQSRAMGWSETIAQYVRFTFEQSEMCAESRAAYNYTAGLYLWYPPFQTSLSYMTLIDASPQGNEYQAWPWLIYLSENPDSYKKLGWNIVLDLFQKYKVNSNETPFHTLNRIAAPLTSQGLVARYWARMAFVDFGIDYWQYTWNVTRNKLDYNNTTPEGSGTWRVQEAKRPLYMGSNIIPLNRTSDNADGSITVRVDGKATFSATLAVRSNDNTVEYAPLSNTTATGSGNVFAQQIAVELLQGQEIMLVVANTPDALLDYDNYDISGAVAVGLDYSISLTGATVLTSLDALTPACAYERTGCLPVPRF
ncbi:hypothetical protein BDZ85DRAFT_299412 [Elsinoe ampelina]|uniref:Peptidase M60 domain-containing protein n=1 Tax=Elsinoe ampelina TaxID=302913 RepID=A0A6A6FZE1_9PEZI|nr:hypothetical protein BDZ85DRAFT_299412 [Elsinoe ampelina]